MIPKQLLESKAVQLAEMLDAREGRRFLQEKLQAKYPYPLISFTLNMVGEYKVFPLSIKTYYDAVALIERHCYAWGLPIKHKEEVQEHSGYECFLSVDSTAQKIKKILCSLEEREDLGRLYDIDVINLQGEKESREAFDLPPRTCLLCEESAFVCARSRRHTVAELWQRETEMMWQYFSREYSKSIATIATRALLYEVSATPKPGLVDQNNTGAHQDMDIHTFEASALALLPYFQSFVQTGIEFAQEERPLGELFPPLRPLGIEAELAMLQATKGINTHKGIIFSLGIVLGAMGYLYGSQQAYSRHGLQEIIMALTQDLGKDFHGLTHENAVSNGEKLYVNHGIRGIRGEAIDGYPSLFQVALPQLEENLAEGYSLSESGVVTLLHILKETQDSNLIHRGGVDAMEQVQEEIQSFFATHHHATLEEKLGYLQQLDEDFIQRNLSPGGSADVLALTYFIYFYESEWGEGYGF